MSLSSGTVPSATPWSNLKVAIPILGTLVFLSIAAAAWDRLPGDLSLMRLVQSGMNPFTEQPLSWVNTLGRGMILAVLTTGVVTGISTRGRWRIGAILGSVIALEAGAVFLLKALVDRPRPVLPTDLQILAESSTASFPSGHVTLTVVTFGAFVYLLTRHWLRKGNLRRLTFAILFVPILLTGPARVAWGVHWPSDVLGGYLLAFLGLQLLVVLHERFGTPTVPAAASASLGNLAGQYPRT
jgi:undecaprenyl-diphosphatase